MGIFGRRRPPGPFARRRPCGKSVELLWDVLVDLVRFELTTSSMPFKKYQSFADFSTRNKRLSTRPRWTPLDAMGPLLGVWTPRGLQDSHTGDWHAACFPARGCGLLYLLSAEGDNNQFPYKDDAHVGSKNGTTESTIDTKRTNQPIGSVDRWLGLKYQLSSGNRQETADVDGHPSSSELKLPPLRLFHLLRRSSWLAELLALALRLLLASLAPELPTREFGASCADSMYALSVSRYLGRSAERRTERMPTTSARAAKSPTL